VRATSVGKADALGRPRRSVQPLWRRSAAFAHPVNEDTPSKCSWQVIATFYDDMVLRHHQPFEPMRAIVHRLAASPSASELHGNTSMLTLLVSNEPAHSWMENVLRVTFLPESQEFEFEYSHYYADTNTTNKRCSVSEGWDTLARFVRYKFGTLLPDDGNA
jgi:hypothetical protein